MGRIHEDNAASIGRTPLVRINNLTRGARATVLAKIEGRNPALLGEVPDRGLDGLGRGEARRPETRQGDPRGDEREHRHRPRLRRGPRAATSAS